MRETPETDAAVENTTLHDRNHPRIDWVPADFARTLERERDEAREAAHSFRSSYYAKSGINKGGCAFPWEGDEAREQNDKIQTELKMWRDGNILHEVHRNELEKVEQERDEAREKYATEATEHMLAVNKLCGERDEALEKLNPLRQSLRDSLDEVLRLTLENRIF